MTEYRDLIPVIVEREQAVMPDWCDSWGIKSVCPDSCATKSPKRSIAEPPHTGGRPTIRPGTQE